MLLPKRMPEANLNESLLEEDKIICVSNECLGQGDECKDGVKGLAVTQH